MNKQKDEIVLMAKTKDGQHRCVPVGKVKEFQNNEKNRLTNSYTEQELKNQERTKKLLIEDFVTKRFKDIKNSKLYTPEVDKIIYDTIENGHCSSARVQRILNSGYPRAMMIIDELKDYGYISDYDMGYKCLITKEFFDIIVEKRK